VTGLEVEYRQEVSIGRSLEILLLSELQLKVGRKNSH